MDRLSHDDPVAALRADLDRIRATARDAGWEADCLRGVGDLLDGIERARRAWDDLAARLKAARETENERDRERARAERLRAQLEQAEAECARLAHVEREREAAWAELEKMRKDVARLEAALAEHRDAKSALDATCADLAAARARLEEVVGERDRLAALERDLDVAQARLAAAAREREEAQAALREVETLKARLAHLEREKAELARRNDETFLLVCDLRVRANRLEQERDDAESHARRKTKRILKRIHAALDEAGAPHGDQMSYGERIRLLRNKLERGGTA